MYPFGDVFVLIKQQFGISSSLGLPLFSMLSLRLVNV